MLVALLVWGGASSDGLVGWLAWLGALVVLVVIGRGWIIRVDDLGDSIRVVNWIRTVGVAWSDVERFEFDGGVSVRRTDLTNVPVSAFPAVSRDAFGIAERRNEAAFRALEATRKRRHQQARHRGPA
jgi:Bacterial PH domain